MKKILIIGSSGAGKSTLARKLSEKTGIKIIHLDKLYWKPNWVEPTDKAAWRRTLIEVQQGESWIIDGNYGDTMELRLEACDTAILLDMPRHLCLWRVIKRFVKFRGRTRPDMTEGCNEQLDWEFIQWVWKYPKHSKPMVETRLKKFENEKTIIRLKSQKEVEKFLQEI